MSPLQLKYSIQFVTLTSTSCKFLRRNWWFLDNKTCLLTKQNWFLHHFRHTSKKSTITNKCSYVSVCHKNVKKQLLSQNWSKQMSFLVSVWKLSAMFLGLPGYIIVKLEYYLNQPSKNKLDQLREKTFVYLYLLFSI